MPAARFDSADHFFKANAKNHQPDSPRLQSYGGCFSRTPNPASNFAWRSSESSQVEYLEFTGYGGQSGANKETPGRTTVLKPSRTPVG